MSRKIFLAESAVMLYIKIFEIVRWIRSLFMKEQRNQLETHETGDSTVVWG